MGTAIAAAVVILMMLCAVYRLRKNKRAGKSSCGCSCANCPSSDICRGGAVKPKME